MDGINPGTRPEGAAIQMPAACPCSCRTGGTGRIGKAGQAGNAFLFERQVPYSHRDSEVCFFVKIPDKCLKITQIDYVLRN